MVCGCNDKYENKTATMTLCLKIPQKLFPVCNRRLNAAEHIYSDLDKTN